jgi:hypothetical protein
VEAEVEDEVPLEQSRSIVAEVTAAEVRMDCKPAELRDTAPHVRALEAHRSRAAPLVSFADLDHEATKCRRLVILPLELAGQRLTVELGAGGEKRPHVVVREHVEHEVEVVARRASHADALAFDHGS